jgi:glyoxylase-like metal-dependent hydrolase (beta-lactamase superfamily II)
MKISAFNICNFLVDGGAMFGVVPKLLWNRVYPANESNQIILTLRSLVVETGNRVVLIDTGFGDKQSQKFFDLFGIFGGDGLINGLANLGYKPSDITDVVHTHLHSDHCGGGIGMDKNGSYFAVFPNAKYHISQKQWEWAINPNAREADTFFNENILPIKDLGLLNLIESDCYLTDGVELRIFDGHTKGQIVPIIHMNNGKKLVFAADLFPTSAHIHLAWNMSYDVEPLVTMQEKEVFLNEAIKNNYIFYYQHDYYTECSDLKLTPKGVRAGEKFSLSGVLQ